jgi:predicted enzyme involved in methoxymalonyl-ACP biosynthesis
MKNEENLAYFLNEAKTIKTRGLEKKLRVAFLASFSINGLEETMRVKCFQKGIECITYVADYNQYNQEILNHDSELYQFRPDITFLILDTRHILGEYFFSWHTVPHDEKPKFVEDKINEIKKLYNTFEKNLESKLVITSLQIPSYSSYGISKQQEIRGLKEIVSEINNKLFNHCSELHTNHQIFIYDFNEFISKFGEKNIFNYKQFFSGDIKISIHTKIC